MPVADHAPAAPGRAWAPVSSAGPAFVRIAFGVAIVVNCALYLPVLVSQYYVDTTFSFGYPPLTFVRPLPGPGMHLAYLVLAGAGALVAVGRWYRPAIATVLVVNTFIFLSDSTYYQNHEYLISLLALILLVVPGVEGRWSLDARRHPDRATDTVPAWVVWLLRFQIGVPYFFGGVAKLNGDWLRGEPLRTWLAERTELEPMHTVLTTSGVVWTMTYGALVLDLLAVGLLLHRRTRPAVFVVLVCFHVLNAWLFGLFIFPWLMIAATTIFFPPDWPLRVERWWRTRQPSPEPAPAAAAADDPATEVAVTAAGDGRRRLVAATLAAWVAVQLLLPFRHLAHPGDPSWTERGHSFAWHMKLRDKDGQVTFRVATPDGTTTEVDPADHLGDKQVARLAGHPQRLVLFARHLSDLHGGAEVHADAWVSLNGRPPQRMVDPDVDLSALPTLGWGEAEWIEPLRYDLDDEPEETDA